MKQWLFFYLILAFAVGAAEKKICLNMIVKDEHRVIKRCLESVKPYIDYWIIVDTGSSDGTQEEIRAFMKGIPGELHERPWVNFGYNRNEALQLAKGKGDYLLFIDADEVLEGAIDRSSLGKDIYTISVRTADSPLMTFQRAFLINNHLDWTWHGAIHESITCGQDHSFELLPNIALSAEFTDGNRSLDPKKHWKDAQMLEKILLDEPNNPDYIFYLAQSYNNAQEYGLALKNYRKRAQMQGRDQLTFWAKYATARLEEFFQMDPNIFINSYCNAFQYRPTRAEPLFRLGQYFLARKNYILSYLIGEFGLTIPPSTDTGYTENWVHSFGMLAIYGDSALQLGNRKAAAIAYKKIAEQPDTPKQILAQIGNLRSALEETPSETVKE